MACHTAIATLTTTKEKIVPLDHIPTKLLPQILSPKFQGISQSGVGTPIPITFIDGLA